MGELEPTGRLPSPELMDLWAEEAIIERGLSQFFEVGGALLRVRDGEKYRADGHANFAGYCRKRWDIGLSRAYQFMDAVELSTIVEDSDTSVYPTHESQVRPLAPLRDEPERAREAWDRAVELADGEQPRARDVAEAVAEVRGEVWAEPEPEPAEPAKVRPKAVDHPATFSQDILSVLEARLRALGSRRVLDPFAGTGKLHDVCSRLGIDSVGIELEPEWAGLHERTAVGDARALPFESGSFDAVATSPTYGNTMAGHHEQGEADLSVRFTYRHTLGRMPTEGNSGTLYWGHEYRELHRQAWAEACRVLSVGGYFLLNVKDFIQDGERVHVSAWHIAELSRLGLVLSEQWEVPTRGLSASPNPERIPYEFVYIFRKPLARLEDYR